MSQSTPDTVYQIIEQALDTYDIAITGDITVTEVGDNEYEAAVPFEGELLFDEVFDDQGTLLYTKHDGELSFTGIRDGQLLLTVILD